MDIRRAPVSDLLKYFSERLGEKNYDDIFDVVAEYYSKLSDYPIKNYYPNISFADWCFCDRFSADTAYVPGMILHMDDYYAIVCEDTEYCYIMNIQEGLMKISSKDIKWTECGLMSKFFRYAGVEQHNNYSLGQRKLQQGDSGMDVLVFQSLLQKMNPNVHINGIMDAATIGYYVMAQKSYGLKPQTVYHPDKDQLLCRLP